MSKLLSVQWLAHRHQGQAAIRDVWLLVAETDVLSSIYGGVEGERGWGRGGMGVVVVWCGVVITASVSDWVRSCATYSSSCQSLSFPARTMFRSIHLHLECVTSLVCVSEYI